MFEALPEILCLVFFGFEVVMSFLTQVLTPFLRVPNARSAGGSVVETIEAVSQYFVFRPVFGVCHASSEGRYTQFGCQLLRRCACRVPCLNCRHDFCGRKSSRPHQDAIFFFDFFSAPRMARHMANVFHRETRQAFPLRHSTRTPNSCLPVLARAPVLGTCLWFS